MARNVVLGLIEGLEGKGHVLVTDNYFSSIALFTKLANRDFYATGTMTSNYVGLPSDLKNLALRTEAFRGLWSGRCMHQRVSLVLCGRTRGQLFSFPRMRY
jgi:hypothetical protein